MGKFENINYTQQENIKRVALKENPFKIFQRKKDNIILTYRFFKKFERYNFQSKTFFYVVGYKGEVLISNIHEAIKTAVYKKIENYFKNLKLNGFEELL